MEDDASVSDVDKPFVETVRIQNFGCARDVALELTRLHALIGPNDSGKSTVLAAIRTACELIRIGQQALAREAGLDPRGVDQASIAMTSGTDRIACVRGSGYWVLRRGLENGLECSMDPLGEQSTW